jgi:uncharacterized protein YhaN
VKIAELQLIAFGPFTDCQLDLSAGSHGLHILYGPNEAGKSSSLRAITHFLYGFPSSTPDDFQHPYKSLRVGARLEHSDGTQLTSVRRKAQKLSLRCGQDQEPVADDALLRFMGDVDQEFFQSMFGINHHRLREGGQDIAAGKGRLGELLFAAGAGVVNLQQLQNDLQTEADALLKSTLRSGSIQQHLQDYLEHRKAVGAAQETVDTWKTCDQQHQQQRQRKAELDQQLSQIQAELTRLQRIESASAPIDRWKTRKQKLQLLAHVPRLEGDFAKHTNELLLELKTGQMQSSGATTELAKIAAQLESLIVPPAILAAFDAIEALRDRVGGIRKSLVDRPAVEARCRDSESEAQELMRELDRSPDLSTIEELRLPRDKTVKIRSLGTQLQRQLERLQAQRKNCEQLQLDISSGEQRLSVQPITFDLPALRASLRAVQQQGDVQAELNQAEADCGKMQRQVELALKKLPLFSGQLTELECLPLPSSASLDRFETEFSTADGQLQALNRTLAEDEQQRDALSAQLSQLESGQAVPTLAELDRMRRLRQYGWQLFVATWESKTTDDTALHDYLKNFPESSDLTSAYQHAVLEADRIADALRTDANRVATKAKLHNDLAQISTRYAKRQAELQQTQSQRAEIEQRWQALWTPTGITPLAPDEMQDWLRQLDQLSQQLKQLRQLESDCTHKRKQLTELTQRLKQIRDTLDPVSSNRNPHSSSPKKAEQPALLELTQWVDDKLTELTSQVSRHEQWNDQLRDDRAKLAAAQAEFARFETELGDLQSEWASEMERLGLEQSALPEQANNRLDTLGDLFSKFKEVDRFRTRLQHIDRDAQLFSTDVASLCAAIAPELHKLPAEQALSALVQQLEQARVADREHKGLIARQAELTLALQQAQQRGEQAKIQLDEMLRQAQVSDYDQLAPAADQARERREHELAASELEDEILGFCAGATLPDFVAEVEKELSCEQSLQQRMALAEQTLAELKEQRDAVIGQIRAAEIELQKFDGSSRAAEANAQCESIAAQLEVELQSLAVRRVAAVVLKAAIERHREKNQGPILGRASQIFQQITLGQYSGLQAEYNEKGEPILAGLRNGTRVLVEGMSDGTCDQLYLALRLASLEAWLSHHEPIPLIVDDILMNFDDARSVATLHVLAELSHRTQVIFFTHHQHLVNLARQHLSPQELFITNIPSHTAAM